MKTKIKKKLENKKIALLGLGLENKSLLKYLRDNNLDFDITICDFRDKNKIKDTLEKYNLNYKDYKYQLENAFNNNLNKYSILLRSPGWPLSCPGVKKAKKEKTEVSSAMNLFFAVCPSQNIIGVTGSKGKGTTATLITEILKNNNKNTHLGGNIGIAPFDFLKNIKTNDFVILELSSFQLQDLKYSPKYSIITNLYHEHLSPADPSNPNYHNSFENYLLAKANIFIHQNKKSYLITKNEVIQEYKKNCPETLNNYNGNIIKYTKINKNNIDTKLKGDYNLENISASLKLAEILNLNYNKNLETIKTFKNLEHRLEFVDKKKKVKYFNNSFSTTPESTILDINSFKESIILIAGGSDKGANFSPLAKTIKYKVKKVILFPGKGSESLKKALLDNTYNNKNIIEVKSMKEAVKSAYKTSNDNDVVLLSPACASFGIFKNYKQRGQLFKDSVYKL